MKHESTIKLEWMGKLRHMLGATEDMPQKSHGYRNHYCAQIGSDPHDTMLEMETAGLVTLGATINEGRDQYFHATRAGCEAIGLTKAAIARAFEDGL